MAFPKTFRVSEIKSTPITNHKSYIQVLKEPITIAEGIIVAFETSMRISLDTQSKHQHKIGGLFIQKILAKTKKPSEFAHYVSYDAITTSGQHKFINGLEGTEEQRDFVAINKVIKKIGNEPLMKPKGRKVPGKKRLNNFTEVPTKSVAPWTQAPVVPKEIERKFLPAPTEIFNSSWINQVLVGYIKSVDLIQSYVKLDSIKFHIAEDTVFLQSLNKTMNTPIVAVEVGNANCVILKELFASTEKKAVRIRKQDQEFFFTIKLDIGKTGECIEIEVSIDLQTYMAIKMYCGREISKMRLSTMHDGLKYEVDIFKNSIFGFTLIELELPSIDHPVNLPAWVGKEVTGDPTYFNSNLLRYNSYKNGVLSV